MRGRKVGTSSFRRIGGLGFRPTAMAADERTVYLYGGCLKRLWIDEPPDGSYSGDGDLRQVFSYTEDIVGLAPFDGELYAAAPKSGLVFCSERYKGVPTSGPKWRKVKTGVTGGCLAVAADELSREVHFSVGGDLYHGAVLPVDGKPADKWDLANVRRIAGIGGVCRLARAVGSPSVVFSTTNGTVGVLTAQTDRIRWTKPWTEVRGLAALPSSVVVSDAKGVSLLDMRDGTPQARYEKDGMEFGQVAAEMPWFVVEERTGNRLLRLEVGE